MSIALPALAVAFAAFCVWRAIRLVNRRERLGRRFWITVALVVLVGYPLSFGPVYWLDLSYHTDTRWIRDAIFLYRLPHDAVIEVLPQAIADVDGAYMDLWIPAKFR